MMRFGAIEYFIAVAESGSLRRAAEQLYITQPALSKQIKLLESDIGHPLFVRTSQGMVLTEQGSALYQEIHPIVKSLKRTLKRHQKIDTVRFGLSPFLAASMLPDLNDDTEIPIEISSVKEECSAFIPMLESGDIDAAVIQDYPMHKGLVSKFLYEEDFKVIVHKDHPLAGKQSVSIQECLEYPQILPPAKSRIFQHIESKNYRNQKVLSVPYALIQDYVAKGYGISYVPASTVEDRDYRALSVVDLNEKELIRKLYLFASRTEILNRVSKALNQT